MPVIRAAQSVVHQMHGTSFTSYARHARPSAAGNCAPGASRFPGGTVGVPHHVSREEVLYILSGTLRVTVDGEAADAAAGDVVLVPAGARFGASNQAGEPATAWVTTTVGFARRPADGSWFTPPWTR